MVDNSRLAPLCQHLHSCQHARPCRQAGSSAGAAPARGAAPRRPPHLWRAVAAAARQADVDAVDAAGAGRVDAALLDGVADHLRGGEWLARTVKNVPATTRAGAMLDGVAGHLRGGGGGHKALLATTRDRDAAPALAAEHASRRGGRRGWELAVSAAAARPRGGPARHAAPPAAGAPCAARPARGTAPRPAARSRSGCRRGRCSGGTRPPRLCPTGTWASARPGRAASTPAPASHRQRASGASRLAGGAAWRAGSAASAQQAQQERRHSAEHALQLGHTAGTHASPPAPLR